MPQRENPRCKISGRRDEKERNQEKKSLCRINDSFKKFVEIKDNIEPWQDDKGIQYIGIEQLLLEEESLR